MFTLIGLGAGVAYGYSLIAALLRDCAKRAAPFLRRSINAIVPTNKPEPRGQTRERDVNNPSLETSESAAAGN